VRKAVRRLADAQRISATSSTDADPITPHPNPPPTQRFDVPRLVARIRLTKAEEKALARPTSASRSQRTAEIAGRLDASLGHR
jgi:hypothetical protein